MLGNHPNQFVDGMMMFTQSPRDVFLLIAASSVKNKAIEGFFANLQKAIPVYRREDNKFDGKGTIKINLVDSNLFELKLEGAQSFEDQNIKKGDQISFPLEEKITTEDDAIFRDVRVNIISNESSNIVRGCICTEYRPIESLVQLDGQKFESFKVFPKLDQSKAYEAIYSVLARGDWFVIFFILKWKNTFIFDS